MYGLKTEVAVSAQPPHYCTHVSPFVEGAVHDFELFKSGYARYLSFLLKLPEEHAALNGDQAAHYWALLCDKGYIGPESASPDVHRICPVKNPQNHHDRTMNNLLSQIRVHVECYFGRLLGLFNIFRSCYRWSHKHYNQDFLICCGLTNEVITLMSLDEMDSRVYRSWQESRLREYEEKEQKRKMEQNAYREQK